MFAEAQSEELLNLLSQVRLVADEEERSDGKQQQQEEQQQQQRRTADFADTQSSLKSTMSASLTLGSGSRAISPTSGVGRYTASSTAAAAVNWTVQDNSSCGNRGGDGQPRLTSPERIGGAGGAAAAAVGRRTPATGVKVLHHSINAPLAAPPPDMETELYDVLREPKQLFFVDAHKRAALQQQQQQQQHVHTTPSSPFTSSNAATANTIAASGFSRSVTSFSPDASIGSGGGSGGGGVRRPPPPFSAADPEGMNVPTCATAFPSAVPRDRVTSPGGASVLSTVLSGYTQPTTPPSQPRQRGGVSEDGLARIAAEFERVAAFDERNSEAQGMDRRARLSALAGVEESRAASDVWTPASATPAAPFAPADRSALSPFTYTHPQPTLQQQQQQQQQATRHVTPSKAPSYSVSATDLSPFLSNAGASARGHGGYVDPTSARVARGSTATTPLTLAASHTSPPSHTSHPPYASTTSAAASSAAEAAVANFFRASSAGPENITGGVSGLRRSAQENDAAWRLSVEAELNDLQRGAHPLYNATSTAAAAAANIATPTTAISPLPPTSTTPYHQLLSQLRYSPQQGTTTGGAAGVRAAQANTPPERRGFVPTPQGQTDARRAAAAAAGGVDKFHPALHLDGPATGSVARYTAHVPRTSPFGGSIDGTHHHQQQMSGGGENLNAHREPLRSWPAHSSSSLAETSAVWDRVSPFDRAAAVAAANTNAAGGAAALFHTPDTVAKPVTLSSIAAQLQGREIAPLLDEDVAYSPSSLQQQQQQQQQQQHAGVGALAFRNAVELSQRFPTPPSFTTAATAGSCLSPQQQQQQQQRMPLSPYQHAAQQASNYTSGGPQQQQQQQQQQQRASAAAAAAAVTGGSQRVSHPSPPRQAPGLRGSPVDASATSALHSPPSCSLRPSPQTRAADGSSPALRRYVITTPNTRANATNSGGKRSEGSPTGTFGSTGGAGAARDARPRVQLSHVTGPTTTNPSALRSPLHTATSATATPTAGAGYGVGGVTNTSPYHHSHPANNINNANSSSSGGHHAGQNTTGNFGSTAAASAASAAGTSVSSSAVRALIERLQALAPVVLSSAASTPTNNNNNNAEASATATATYTAAESGAVGSAISIPDVASAAVILAMSHDQHGCRLLQAVLDAECDGDVDEKNSSNSNEETRSSRSPTSTNVSAAERRRQRRAEAFYHSTAVQVILRAIEPKLDTVMADGYGNFLLQKVFDMAPDAERQRLLRLPSLQHHLCAVACSPHGTFAVQRLVETVRNTEEERLVFVALERDLLRLLTNANGGHVLMKVMECIRRQYTALTTTATNTDAVPAVFAASSTTLSGSANVSSAAPPLRTLLLERVDALFAAIATNLLFVCQHKQGCCIVQKFLDFLNACAGLAPSVNSVPAETLSSPQQQQQQQQQQSSVDYFDRMSALLLPHIHELSVHPFGNYVVTRLVDVSYARGSTATIDAVATAMQRDLVRMCTNKFASNVVEHILRHCSERRIRSVCQTLMTRPTGPHVGALSPSSAAAAAAHPSIARLPLTTVVMDSYGNYVVQTLLTVAPVDELASTTSVDGGMLPVLQLLLPLLSSRNFGRKLETKTELAVLRVEQYQQQQQQQQQRRRGA